MLDRVPSRVLTYWRGKTSLVGSPDLTWRREVITVAFYGGSEQVRRIIEQTAAEWTSAGGKTRFSFRDQQGRFRSWSPSDAYRNAAIRIAFSEGQDGGFWSAIGTMADTVPANEQTMNLGGFDTALMPFDGRLQSSDWSKSYERSTILHEFGHALGLSHEHFHPECQNDLKIEQAIQYLMGSPNYWTEEQARFNVDASYYFGVTSGAQTSAGKKRPTARFDISKNIDRASVMLYSFPNHSVYRSGTRSICRPSDAQGFATLLSKEDLASFARYYTMIP